MKAEYQDDVRITRSRGKDKQKERIMRANVSHNNNRYKYGFKEVKPKRNDKWVDKYNKTYMQ
tara:strand:+ start:144 stop:329 length:186 start_codon:yes stop_codon:yes gene_type:complete